MGIYIQTNSKNGSFNSIACLAEVFSPDILIYFEIYLLNAMKGVRCGICRLRGGTEKASQPAQSSLTRLRGAPRQKGS